MKVYKTKAKKFSGSDYHEIKEKTKSFYKQIIKKTKRRPYVKSAYFKKQKIFLELFWNHLFEKNFWDQSRRMKFFACGIELIQKAHLDPISKENPNKKGEILHRFAGVSAESEQFFVQIKEEKRTGQKWLVSIFPKDK
ncbi:MAG: hypothetical protein V1716_04090 [Candidatus Uhrbacteria bacterium]